ncbi:pyruvate dehydrogenase complex dihydrolipoyllysine-residue acetyltransferase [Alteromonas aestuariivivens]|uniref:Acetyltransferase component of pyruvate dehydrogenase complex n=1 Tax=Alteromonas aestuariivivens TaxID=1938339 RepID=A0A3D8MDZ6_9ALTE|nr:pyruvate dehydrogenase complex dihydrolipoyllysine-residue acetyltransferase [Alteromonas aestuariivivens]RDV29089.1 pyruvate dehydrogenase complex dihydrolipoyllysine-residue acetyltransferase [Alteromonas aestuariivivens]
MSDIKDVFVPDLGEDEVEVIELCVAVGDEVEAEASLVTVESDKASMDIPAPFAGTVAELNVKVGDKIKQGDLLAKLSAGGASESAPAEEAPQASAAPAADPAPAPAAASGGSQTIEVKVPDIGDASDVDVIEVLVAEGDTVAAEDGLITLETDKATMDVPSPQAGKVVSLKVKEGDKVSEGSLVLVLEVSGGASESAPVESAAAAPAAAEPVAEAAGGEEVEIEVTVPDIGDASDVDVIDVLVSEGDTVEVEDGLITLETDKATMDVPAPKAGVVTKLLIKQGDKVSQGSAVLMLKVQGAAAPKAEAKAAAAPASAPAPVESSRPKPPPVPHHPSAGEKPKSGKVHASPSVRRLAREFGVDLTQVSGSGAKSRILKEDVQSYVKYELSRPKATAAAVGAGEGGLQVIAPPKVDFSKFGEVEEVPLTRIQKISGPNLHRNWVTIPHVTQFEEADITDLEAFRKQQNVVAEKRKLGFKITPLVFMMKAVADALKAYPVFNTSLSADGESLIQKKYYHIGIAVDTPGGLVVPVVRDVDQKGIYELSKELLEISAKARDGKLKAADMQGSCFTISSLGGIGGTAFTPIVNAPDVAILGVSKSDIKPKWNGKEFEPRLMVPLSLSYDHRVIDGAVAARFAVHLKNVLEDLREMLL